VCVCVCASACLDVLVRACAPIDFSSVSHDCSSDLLHTRFFTTCNWCILNRYCCRCSRSLYIHTWLYSSIQTHMQTCIHECTHAYMHRHTSMCTRMHADTHTRTHTSCPPPAGGSVDVAVMQLFVCVTVECRAPK